MVPLDWYTVSYSHIVATSTMAVSLTVSTQYTNATASHVPHDAVASRT